MSVEGFVSHEFARKVISPIPGEDVFRLLRPSELPMGTRVAWIEWHFVPAGTESVCVCPPELGWCRSNEGSNVALVDKTTWDRVLSRATHHTVLVRLAEDGPNVTTVLAIPRPTIADLAEAEAASSSP